MDGIPQVRKVYLYNSKQVCSFVESLFEADVVGIVLYPMTFNNPLSGAWGGKRRMTSEEEKSAIQNLKSVSNIPVFPMDNVSGLLKIIIEYFQ